MSRLHVAMLHSSYYNSIAFNLAHDYARYIFGLFAYMEMRFIKMTFYGGMLFSNLP